jgi:hypothetical protein
MVTKMQKTVCDQTSCSLFLRNKASQGWSPLFDWPLGSLKFKRCSEWRFRDNQTLLNVFPLSDEVLHKYKTEAEVGISQIQDPLWRRVCLDVLRVLGPVAFKDLWKINLMRISPKERKAYLACPTPGIAETVKNYHFVIVGALKKFYPFLFSIETEISENRRTAMKGSKDSVNLYQHLT